MDPRLSMPGFNLPLDSRPKPNVLFEGFTGFPMGLDVDAELIGERSFYVRDHTTPEEVLMMQVMNEITEKPQWAQKVLDESIAADWVDEIAQTDRRMTRSMKNWIYKELRWKAEMLEKNGFVLVFDVGVVKSDNAISEDDQQALKNAVKLFDNNGIPGDQEDYRTASDDQGVDLVDPSLFPVVYGQTRVLPDHTIGLSDYLNYIGEGELLPVPSNGFGGSVGEKFSYLVTDRGDLPYFSTHSQWLPCEVELLDDGCRIMSYINNAHPVQHKALYKVIEKIITRAVPLWEKSLSFFSPDRQRRTEYSAHPEHQTHIPNGHAHVRDGPEMVLPGSQGFADPRAYELNLRKHFPNSMLQVIVKLSNIELTPEKPNFEEGPWQIEGQLNERICAIAIYHYDSKNVTEHQVHFCQRGVYDMDGYRTQHEPQDHRSVQAAFGFGDKSDQNRPTRKMLDLGGVSCKQGRLITFPNTVQHGVGSFSLVDPSQPGHVKILSLFLVDPHLRIISSANVPPQRDDWAREKRKVVGQATSQLPPNVRAMIKKYIATPMNAEDAKKLRIDHMLERDIRSEYSDFIFREGYLHNRGQH
ncbi:hypothetical protein N7456_001721 [Penicillium angulare]|uniref:Uncharacterized protein n=1 Tax=Penicillium angulare TaxID=116970 RepID=A0A9W9G6Z8_9EURO|nr:hypothetical protein N7456_001721 [Penicillium angulare]